MNWFSLSNFGFTSGTLNSISEAYGRRDSAALRSIISTAFVLFGILSSLILAMVLVLYRIPGIYTLLGVPHVGSATHEVAMLILMSGGLFVASFLLSIVGTVCGAMQEGYLWSFATTSATVMAAILLCATVFAKISLPVYAVTQSGPGVVAWVLLTVYYFLYRHKELMPSPRLANTVTLREIGRPSLLIFISQISDTAVHYSSNVIISYYLGPSSVLRYAVPYSLFMLSQSLCYNILQPLWPAYAEAKSCSDHEWIHRTLYRSLHWAMLGMGVAGAVIVAIGRPVIRIWAGEAAVPSVGLLILLAVYFQTWMVAAVFDSLVCGLGRFRLRLVACLVGGGIFLGGSVALVRPVGVAAMPISGIVGSVVSVFIVMVCLRGVLGRRSL